MNKIRTGDIKIATFDFKQKQDKLIAKLFTRYPILVNLKVLRLLLKYLEELDSPGSIVKFNLTYSDDYSAGSSKYAKC